MKKLLALLGVVVLGAVPSMGVVACQINPDDNGGQTGQVDLSKLHIDPSIANFMLSRSVGDLNVYYQKVVDALNQAVQLKKEDSLKLKTDVLVEFYDAPDSPVAIDTVSQMLSLPFIYVHFGVVSSSLKAKFVEVPMQKFAVSHHPDNQSYANALAKVLQNNDEYPIYKDGKVLDNEAVISQLRNEIPLSISIKDCDTSDYDSQRVDFKITTLPVISNDGYQIGEAISVIASYADAQSSEFTKTPVKANPKPASDDQFAEAIIRCFDQKLALGFVDDNSPLTHDGALENLKSLIYNSGSEFTIPYFTTNNYNKNNVNVEITEPQDNGKYKDNEQATVTVNYSNASTSKIYVVHQQTKEYYSGLMTDKVDGTTYDVNGIDALSDDNAISKLNTIILDAVHLPVDTYSILKSGVFVKIAQTDDGPTVGRYQFQVQNAKTHDFLINTKTKAEAFTVNFSNRFVDELSKINDGLKKDGSETVDIKTMNLSSLISDDFLKVVALPLRTYLQNTTVENFISVFFDPTTGFSKMLPSKMPILNDNGIDPGDQNKDSWNFINAVKEYFAGIGIDIINGQGWTGSTEFDQGANTIKFEWSIYNVFKNLLPDLIHFHNFLSNEWEGVKAEAGSHNIFLEILKYFNLKKENINDDGFAQINSDDDHPPINNFHNFLHDITTGFTLGGRNSGLTTLLSFSVRKLSTTFKIDYDRLWSGGDDPYNTLMRNPFNSLLPNGGQDITKPIHFRTKMMFSIFHISINIDESFNFMPAHLMELKALVRNVFKINDYAKFNYQILSGKFGIRVQQDNTSSEWHYVTSFDDLVNPRNVNMQFVLKDLAFKISAKADGGKTYSISQSDYTLYLQL